MSNWKTEDLGSLSKSEKASLNRVYSRGRAAYGSVRNLSEASGLSKKKVEQFLQTKTSYPKIEPPIRRFRRLQAFSKYILEIWCMDLAFVDKLASQNNGVKLLLVGVDVFFCELSELKQWKLNMPRTLCKLSKKMISRKTLLKNFGFIKEQNMGNFQKILQGKKTLKFPR